MKKMMCNMKMMNCMNNMQMPMGMGGMGGMGPHHGMMRNMMDHKGMMGQCPPMMNNMNCPPMNMNMGMGMNCDPKHMRKTMKDSCKMKNNGMPWMDCEKGMGMGMGMGGMRGMECNPMMMKKMMECP